MKKQQRQFNKGSISEKKKRKNSEAGTKNLHVEQINVSKDSELGNVKSNREEQNKRVEEIKYV